MYPPQKIIDLRFLTALDHEQTSHFKLHSWCPRTKEMNERLRQHTDLRRENEWKRKIQQRKDIASAKRAANREAKRQGKIETL
jgi:hypothetical protein